MNFLTLQQELAAQTGLDQTVSAQATLLKRWINQAQQEICRAFEWPFMRNPTPLVVQTVTDYSTGTVATVLGSSSITFSSTISTSKTGYYIQFVDSKDWFQITAHTAGTATATIEAPALYNDATATFTIRKFFYGTSTSVDRIISISQDVLPYQLIETSYEFFQSFNPGFLSSGTPRLYCMQGYDSSGTPQFRLWPNPDSAINLTVWYLKTPTDLSADADVPVIPAKWHTTVLLAGALAKAFMFLDDSRHDTALKEYIGGVELMKQEYENSLHRHRVMTSIDNQPVGGNLGYMPLPFNYPRNS